MYWCECWLGTGEHWRRRKIKWRFKGKEKTRRREGEQWETKGEKKKVLAEWKRRENRDGSVRNSTEVYDNMKTTSSSRSHSYIHIHWNTSHTEVIHLLYMFISQSLVFSCRGRPNGLRSVRTRRSGWKLKPDLSVEISKRTCVNKFTRFFSFVMSKANLKTTVPTNMACIEELHHKDCIGLHSTNPLHTQCHREKRKRD